MPSSPDMNFERNPLRSEPESTPSRAATLASQLQKIREEERTHLARELHDELGAILLAAKLDLASITSSVGPKTPELEQRLVHLNSMLNMAMALKKKVILGLTPATLVELGLAPSVERLAREFGATAGITMAFDLDNVLVDQRKQLAVYRLVQECLTNIGKHAQATQVGVTLAEHDHAITVTVRDNGVGIGPRRLHQAAKGVLGMRHRVEACGGRFTMTTALGGGTKVTAVFAGSPAGG